MSRKITMDMELRFIDNATDGAKDTSKALDEVEKEAKEAGKQIDELGKKKAKPTIDADSSRVDKKLSKIDSVLKKLGFKKTKTVIDADDRASAKIAKALDKARSWAGKKFTAMAEVKDNNAIRTLDKITSAGKSLAGKTWRATVKILDYATKPLQALKNTLFSIKSLVMAITAGLAAKQLIVNPIGLADSYSSAQIGFSTLLGESRGQKMMDDLDEFAKATPFKSAEVISQTQRMIAMGWNAEDIIDDMTTIGDAAAATGKGEQGLQQIVTALAQIKTKGRLSTEELNQLAEAGISAKKYLAEGLGYGSGDAGIAAMTKDLEDGAIASGAALEALLSGMQEYKGMMDKTANETVSGLWSQIEDTFEINIFRRWGQGLQDGAKSAFGSIVTLLNEADGALEEFGDTVYEVGKSISNWLADKLENAVDRITEITDTFEFKNASLGEKISMLWNGVIVDPLKEWWENGGQEKTAETAGKVGTWMGEMLTKGLLALFGATDILDDGIGKDQGANVAGSFLDGFLEAFDGSAITDAFVDAIGNVWGALPTWAKILLGGYGAGKLAIGGANLVSALGTLGTGVLNGIGGFSIASSALPHLTSAGTGLLGVLGKAGVGLGASTTGGALLAGTAGIAGGVAGGASLIKGGLDLYGSYRSYKEGDKLESKAKAASGGTTLGGLAAGAATGAAIGSVIPGLGTALGALIGGGIGGIAGWIGGNKWADNIREADDAINDVTAATQKLETEEEKLLEKSKMVWQNMKDHFGDIKLSTSEITRLADQIVWGDDLASFEKFTTSVTAAEAALKSLNSAGEQTDRWMWKASLGVKFNEDEIESIKESFDSYIDSAKTYVENKHYEFTAAVSLLVDVESKEGKAIIDSGNAFYTKLQEQLEDLGGQLSEKVDIALEDGVITLNEQKEIENLQQQIATITEKIANAETKAELELVKLKFGKGNLDLESFDAFMAQMQTTLNERIAANDEAFKASVATLQLELQEGAISEDEYNKQLQTLVDGYTGKVDSIKAEILNVELDIIGDAYSDELGKDAAEKLKTALEKSLADGIDPINWTTEQAREYLGVDSLTESAAGAISEMLGGVADQLELVEVDGKLLLDLGIETKENVEEKVEEKVKSTLPETVESTVGVNIKGNKNIQNTIDILAEDFGIPPEHAATVALMLTGDKKLLNKIDVSQLAEEFGIPESQARTIVEKLTGTKRIENRLEILASDFGVPDSISKTISVNITAIAGKVKNAVGKVASLFGFARGGIVGGDSSLEGFARGGIAGYSDGGLVRGGGKIIKVAEEGTPEMIIPLGSQRRERALQLWEKAGNMLGVPGFARGGRTDGGEDEGIRFRGYDPGDNAGGQTVQVDVGGVKVEIQVDARGSDNIVEAIKAQADEISEVVAGILADAIGSQFENTPAKGGA